MPDDLAQKVVALAARSAIREAQHSSRLRRDSDECGFTQFFRDFKAVFGDGTRIVWFRGRDGSYGQPYPSGVPFSDPPFVALTKGKKR